jgi:acetyl-CoA acetyltransferase family protein
MPNPPHDRNVIFLSAARTPMGAFGGSLKRFTATDLGALAAATAIERSGVEPAEFGHVVFGNVIQTSADAHYLARHIGLQAGLPIEVPAVTVNRLCGSGFQAVVNGAQEILLGDAAVCLVGGTESMTQAPHVVRGARWGLRLGPSVPFEDTLWESLLDTYCGFSMAETAENLADEYGIKRRDADEYAVRSQQRAKLAWDEGKFDDEVMSITIKKRGKESEFKADEYMRPDTTLEALGTLRPYFKEDGLVTAGNASGIGDGAAALVLADSGYAKANGLKPLARLVSWGAPQYLAVERELNLDRDKVNVNGGAIAITHPLGMTGARITGHLIHELGRRGGGLGLGSACIGGGQGAAVIVEVFG